MYIWNSLLELILTHPKLRIEYNGTHAPHPKTPLYGRNAYWRLYIEGTHHMFKITAPVKSLNPKQATLDRLLREALKERINNIREVCETDHYGKVYIVKRDPSSICPLVELIEGEYIDPMPRKESA